MKYMNYVTKHPLLWRDLGRLFAVAALMAPSISNAQNEGPTMGWSSWNTFGLNISESIIKSQANAMVTKKLKDVGYDHINIDDGYFGGTTSTLTTATSVAATRRQVSC